MPFNFKQILVIASILLHSFMGYADRLDEESINQYISIIENEENWKLDIISGKTDINKSDTLFQTVELLGAIRCDNEKVYQAMVNKIGRSPSIFGPIRFRMRFNEIALIRIDGLMLEMIIKRFTEYPNYECPILTILMPYNSAIELVKSYRERNKHDPKITDNLNKLENFIKDDQKNLARQRQIPPLHDFTLNHPLYKARQSVIKNNIELAQQILKETKNLTSINSETKTKLLAAVDELAKVRAIEAIEVITPILLLQSEKEVENLDKKYFSLRKYPVGVALVKIGIPSIWGLLDEIAKHSGNDSDEYRKIACNVMSSILIKKAIPGFVNEQLIKYKDNELAQIRLAKLLLLLDEEAEKISLLKPQFRTWKSTDGLFETRAKFISIDKKNDVTLEKENGKQTTIEFPALQKTDQNYVKEFITINKK